MTANALPDTALAMRKELKIDDSDLPPSTVKKYDKLLERKWTGSVRLLKKVISNDIDLLLIY